MLYTTWSLGGYYFGFIQIFELRFLLIFAQALANERSNRTVSPHKRANVFVVHRPNFVDNTVLTNAEYSVYV